ncbi:hypothetical protein EU244_033985 [Rhodococcus qingshengii]|uniref:hypothetical protein n=1 Tax=Rhodococcus qingshengii TaxID=334542 RepID=UPI0014560D38|nr:hypothetical protein [Rhodococcus qingshengii]
MRKNFSVATVLAVASGGWIIYGALTDWKPPLVGVAVTIWAGAVALAVHQARRHA